MKKTNTARLKALISSQKLTFLMEAHNGLSAALVAECGFKGIWASGFSLATAMGLRDSNELTWTQVLDQIEMMVDASGLPVLVDGDTGHGNFNNARRFARKLFERGAGGICIEDKLFPKRNSFGNGLQSLENPKDFAGKIAACKDHVPDPDFMVIARVEALIAGLSIAEALDRAYSYQEAGADAILIHSKKNTADEVISFGRQWNKCAPLVAVPTKYHRTPALDLHASGISAIIWANHGLRSAMAAMRTTYQKIALENSVAGVEMQVAPMEDVFSLLNYTRLDYDEDIYLAGRGGKEGKVA